MPDVRKTGRVITSRLKVVTVMRFVFATDDEYPSDLVGVGRWECDLRESLEHWASLSSFPMFEFSGFLFALSRLSKDSYGMIVLGTFHRSDSVSIVFSID